MDKHRKQVALPHLVPCDVGLHEVAQHVGSLPVFCLAGGNKCGAKLFFDSYADASVLHVASLAHGYTDVYPFMRGGMTRGPDLNRSQAKEEMQVWLSGLQLIGLVAVKLYLRYPGLLCVSLDSDKLRCVSLLAFCDTQTA